MNAPAKQAAIIRSRIEAAGTASKRKTNQVIKQQRKDISRPLVRRARIQDAIIGIVLIGGLAAILIKSLTDRASQAAFQSTTSGKTGWPADGPEHESAGLPTKSSAYPADAAMTSESLVTQ